MATRVVTDDGFDADVLNAKGPVLVDFWAAWCGPCRAIAPVLEELSERFAGDLAILKLDVDQNPRSAAQFRVQSIPTMILFSGGRPIDVIVGALPRDRLIARLVAAVPALAGPQIGAAALAARLASGAPTAIFDLRRPQDFARSHLRGARCVEDLDAAIAGVPADTLVVLVCRTGELSLEAAKRRAEPSRVVALGKGLLDWEGSGHPTYSTREEEELASGS